MQWESIGFKENPFNTDPISQTTLGLYTGRREEIRVCKNVLQEKNILMVVEGARGGGTTSFANNLRFSAQSKKLYFTPFQEIRVEENCSLEALLAMVVANIIREIEIFHEASLQEEEAFKDAKALSSRIAESYRNFGLGAFGFSASYGEVAGANTQPIIVPAGVLGHHIMDLCKLVTEKLGYKYGILIQFNNLDVHEIHEEKYLKSLFNGLRDYFQTDYLSCMLVGDVGLRRFIAQNVDRLDDIISHEVSIEPLSEPEYIDLVERRMAYYRLRENAELPIDQDVFLYLFTITKGRLRYAFGLLSRLMNRLYVGDLTDRVTLDIAKPMVKKLAGERLEKRGISRTDKAILELLVRHESLSVNEIADMTDRAKQSVSKQVLHLSDIGCLSSRKDGRYKYYSPTLDVLIAYSE